MNDDAVSSISMSTISGGAGRPVAPVVGRLGGSGGDGDANVMGLPVVHWVPLLPPDRDDPPYDTLLANGLSFCPDISAGTVLVAPPRLVRAVLANDRDYRLDTPTGDPTRAVLVRAFSSPRVHSRVERMRRHAAILVDRMLPLTHADLEAQFAGPYVTRVHNELIGIPAADDDLVDHLRRATTAFAEGAIASGPRAVPDDLDVADLCGQAHRHLTRLRARPRTADHNMNGDLIGDLVDAGLDTHQIVTHTLTGWGLAEQATRNLLSYAVRDMLERNMPAPGIHATSSRPTSRPASTGRCVEETLRRWSPHRTVQRHTTQNVTLAQHRLPAGTRVTLVLAAANLDPAAFPHPHDYDPHRTGHHRHLAFGHGTHRCPGALLARTATRIALDALTQLPNLRLADPDNTEQAAHPILNGPDRVDLAWD